MKGNPIGDCRLGIGDCRLEIGDCGMPNVMRIVDYYRYDGSLAPQGTQITQINGLSLLETANDTNWTNRI
jgi:hypothetical protein